MESLQTNSPLPFRAQRRDSGEGREATMTLPKPDLPGGGFNFNSFLTVIVMAAMAWVGTSTAHNSNSLIEIKTQLPYVNESVKKLETQFGQLVTRVEVEMKFAELSAKFAALELRVVKVETEPKNKL